MSISDNPIFHNEAKAREWLEAQLWPDGTVCPHCGLVGAAYELHGKRHRPGLYKCKGCDQQFTVTVGTVASARISRSISGCWRCISCVPARRGSSAHQLHRTLEITYRAAWFMAHRIREGMRTYA